MARPQFSQRAGLRGGGAAGARDKAADRARVRQQIEGTPERLRFRMRRNGRTLYTGLYVGPINRQKLREPLVMVGAPIGQCWDIEYLTDAGKWERT